MATNINSWLGIDASLLEQIEATKISDPMTLNAVLNNLAADIVTCLHNNLLQHKISDTGELGRSINMPIRLFGTKFIATLHLEDYYDFINKGVKGKGGTRKTDGQKAFIGPKIPTTEKGAQWIIKAPKSPYYFDTLRPPISKLQAWSDRRGLPVFAVQEKIFRQGLKPKPFYDECIEQSFSGPLWDRFKDQIQVVSAKNITRKLKESLTSKEKVQGMGPHQN